MLAPVDLALVTIRNTQSDIEDGQGEVEASFAERIPLHLLADPAPFLNWREQALERLQRYFPRMNDGRGVAPAPRETLDPAVDLARADQAELVDLFFWRSETILTWSI